MPESNALRLKGTLKQTVMLTAYRALGCILLPALPIALYIRGKKQSGYRQRIGERFGLTKAVNKKKSIVIHGASLGEITALKPIIEQCITEYPSHKIIVTSFTPAGSAKVTQFFGEGVHHTYLPFDIFPCVHLFIQRTQPELMIFMETEIWPNLIHQAHSQNIKLLLINARISDKAYPKYQNRMALIAPSLRRFTQIICQSKLNKERFLQLGAKDSQLSISGNLKFDAKPVALSNDIKALQQFSVSRPTWLIASSHHDEEQLLINTLLSLRKKLPQLFCIWAPRHIERFDNVNDLCNKYDLNVVRRSTRTSTTSESDVLLIDTIGELPQFYSLASVSTVCGSFNNTGGHNPIEPLVQNSVTSFGPNMTNSKEIIDLLLQSKAAFQHRVISDTAVSEEVFKLLTNIPLQEDFRGAGMQFLTEHRGSVAKTMDVIKKIIN